MRRSWLAILAVVVLLVGALGSASASPSNAPSAAIATPTGPHPATIYRVTNLDTSPVVVKHSIYTDANVLTYEFTDTAIPVGQYHEFRVFDMQQIPNGFSGYVVLTVDQYTNDPPIQADVTGYDYIIHQQRLPVIRK